MPKSKGSSHTHENGFQLRRVERLAQVSIETLCIPIALKREDGPRATSALDVWPSVQHFMMYALDLPQTRRDLYSYVGFQMNWHCSRLPGLYMKVWTRSYCIVSDANDCNTLISH